MKIRPAHALVVALLALVVALAGTSYAAVQIGSKQIKNNSVKGKDVKDGDLTGKDVQDASLTGADLADGSVSKADLAPSAPGCAADQFRLATGCLIKATRSVGTLSSALIDCNSVGGRLPSLEETKLLPLSSALTSGVTWTGGMLNQYEFTGEFVEDTGTKVVLTDFGGNLIYETGLAPRGHHCVVNPS
jgi:hypothetical protein